MEKPDIEQPDIEQPEVKSETTPEAVDIEGLMEQLEAANIKEPEKLKGKLANADQYASIQSERDQVMNELHNVRAELAKMQSAPKANEYENYDMDSKPVDLVDTMRQVIREEKQADAQKAAKANQYFAAVQAKITGDPRYKLVKDKFEEKISEPMTQFGISNGQINPLELYSEMVVDHFQSLAAQAVTAFKQLKGTKTVQAPHVEGQARVSSDQVRVPTDKDKKIEQIKKKGASGAQALHEDEMDAILDAELGDLFKEQ